MTNEMERPSTALGHAIADRVLSAAHTSMTLEEIREKLTDTFEELRLGDQRSVESIKQFIQENELWSTIDRDEDDEIAMDAYIPGEDGSVVYIQVRAPRPMLSRTADSEQKVAYLKAHGENAHVGYYSAAVLDALRFEALPGQDLIDLIRGTYWRVPTIDWVEGSQRSFWSVWGTSRNYRLETYFLEGKELIYGSVPLQTDVTGESVDDHLDRAKHQAITHLIEQQTSGEEYKELLDTYSYNKSLSPDERKAIYDRLMTIQAENGFPDAPLDWRTVIPQWLDLDIYSRRDGDFDDKITEADIATALREVLTDPVSLYLYEQEVRVRSIARHAVQVAQLTGKAVRVKEIEFVPPEHLFAE